MLRHQFGQHLVLDLDLLGQIVDPFLVGLAVAAGLGCKGRGPVLEKLLLPTVKDGRLESIHRRASRSAPVPTNGAAGWRPSLRGCSSFVFFSRVLSRYLNGRTLSPFPAEAEQMSIALCILRY